MRLSKQLTPLGKAGVYVLAPSVPILLDFIVESLGVLFLHESH